MRQALKSINIKAVGFVLIALSLPGCCWMAKRSCFPTCPKPLPPKVVTVEKSCQLPPALKLPAVVRTPCELPGGQVLVCFDKANAGRLAQRQALMKDWIKDVRARCSAPASQPASRPTQ